MNLPHEMTLIEITSPGGPEVLQPRQEPMPVAGPGEVLIRVHAAGVNRPDALQRAGTYPMKPGMSPFPGLEVAGVVAARAANCGAVIPRSSIRASPTSTDQRSLAAKFRSAPQPRPKTGTRHQASSRAGSVLGVALCQRELATGHISARPDTQHRALGFWCI